MKINNIFLLFICIAFFSSCHRSNNMHEVPAENKISGHAMYGVLAIPNENKYYITPTKGGIIKSVFVKNGDTINSGARIISLYNPEFIELQKEYIANKYELEYLKEEFKRQGELGVENVTSLKKMQKAQADYFIKEAICNSLEIQLQNLDCNTDILLQKGPFNYFVLRAPVSGIIQLNKVSQGLFYKVTDNNIYIRTTDSMYVKIFQVHECLQENLTGSDINLYNGSEFIAEAIVLGCCYNETDGLFWKACIKNKTAGLCEGLKLRAELKK